MTGQVDLLGIYIPALIPVLAIAYVINWSLRIILTRMGFYRIVWHRSVFDLGTYAIVLSVVFLLSRQFES
jgi:uncharacterized protein YebE (UPF0316 family)